MKTVLAMHRQLFGGEISQHGKTGYFSATDLVKLGNKWRLANDLDPFTMKSWLGTKGTKEFVAELEKKYGQVRVAAKGKGTHTWMHTLLFIDMALAISPKLKLEAYEWLFDLLIKYRNDSGDSYHKMCGALFIRAKNKTYFNNQIQEVDNKIKTACGVTEWRKASEPQLRMRNKLHNSIALLAEVLNNNDEAVRLAILKGF